MQRAMPIFRWGFIGPGRAGPVQVGPGYRFYRFVPTSVMMVQTGLVDLGDYTQEGVNRAIKSFRECVDLLVDRGVDCIVLGGAPISAQLGRARVRELLDETTKRTGILTSSTLESAIAGMNHLNVRKLSVGSRWADEVNQGLKNYLGEGGIDVVYNTALGHWAADTAKISFQDRLQLELDLGEKAAQMAPEADGVLLPGGAMAEHAIVPVEEKYGKATFTNYNTEVWHTLIHPGVIPAIEGWGRLLATP